MKGIELARGYYETYGKPMLEQKFGDIMCYLAVGFVGSGSERYGYDDDVSRDHDFEPGFCIFIPGEDKIDRRTEFLLMRAYTALPKSFEGHDRQKLMPVGGNRNGVIRTADFYADKVGAPDGRLSVAQWLTVPEHYLSEATNGEVFFDGYGEFTRIRSGLLSMPEDIRRKRIAGNLLLMAQSGCYNYSRCLAHNEAEAAQLAAVTFVRSAANVYFLLKRKYMPFYKWMFRALRELDGGEELCAMLSRLMSGDIRDAAVCEQKADTVGKVCRLIVGMLREQELTQNTCDDLERHAYSVNDGISDGELRNMSIFAAV